ncbi:MAG: nucleotidyltransferase domain-containing protein [Chitinispirillaceae bacterium]|nr:nucleotidyltransferase domain-containing protein [Chitinispirillaceae bacterium]
MNLLSQILSSNVRAEIFRLLFGMDRRELHMRDIERRSGFAIGTVRQEASKLLRLGLIQERRDGNRVYFKANVGHPLFVDICNLVLKTSGLTDVIKKALEGADISFAFVFGSIASGKQKPDSDIDLFVVGRIGLRGLSKLLKNASDMLGKEINSNVMTEEEFGKRIHHKEHFVSSVLGSPKLMIIGDENEFARLGK